MYADGVASPTGSRLSKAPADKPDKAGTIIDQTRTRIEHYTAIYKIWSENTPSLNYATKTESQSWMTAFDARFQTASLKSTTNILFLIHVFLSIEFRLEKCLHLRVSSGRFRKCELKP